MIGRRKSAIAECDVDYPRTTLFVSYFLLSTWLLIGMVIFHFVESPHEGETNDALLTTTTTSTTVDNNSNTAPALEILIIDAKKNVDKPAGENNLYFSLLENVRIASIQVFTNETSTYTNVTFSRLKITPCRTVSKRTSKWDWSGSLFFCLTVVTTIGYGHLAPATDFGKFICVVYAIVGIPLCFNVVGLFQKSAVCAVARMHRQIYRLSECLLRKYFFNNNNNKNKPDGNTMALSEAHLMLLNEKTPGNEAEAVTNKQRLERNVWMATCIVALFLYYVFVCSASGIIAYLEGWAYFSSLYYAFITLTTIGLGDLIAGQNVFKYYWMFASYRAFLTIFIFTGMAFASLLIHELQTIAERFVQLLVHSLFCRHKKNDQHQQTVNNNNQAPVAVINNNDQQEDGGGHQKIVTINAQIERGSDDNKAQSEPLHIALHHNKNRRQPDS